MAPPTNDNIANSDTLVGDSGSVSGTTFDATKEASESTTIYAGTSAQSVWWDFTPSTTGWYKFWIHDADVTYHGVYGFDNTNLEIEVFPDGVLTDMTSTNKITDANRENSNKYNAECVAFLTGGNQYFVRVACSKSASTTNSQTSDFTLHWSPISAPANDDLASALSLGSAPVSQTGETTYDATFQSGEVIATTLGGSGYDAEQSVWYTFTPSTTGKYRIQVNNIVLRGDNGLQGILQVSTQSTLAGYTPANELGRISFPLGIFGVTDADGYFDLTASTTYYIRVSAAYDKGGFSQASYNGTAFDFDLAITITNPPANDDFGSPTVLSTTLPGSLTGESALDSTEDSGQPTDFPFVAGDQSIWYSFTPTVSGKYFFKIPHSSLVYDGGFGSPSNGLLAMALYNATTLAGIVSANQLGYKFADWNVSSDTILYANLVSGTTYRLAIEMDGTPFNSDSMTFDLEWDLVPPPSNDDVANAEIISGASGSTAIPVLIGATPETSEPPPFYWQEDEMTGYPTVWYKWTAPSSGWFEFKAAADVAVGNAYDCTIYTGTNFGDFVVVVSNEGGGEDTGANDQGGKTVLRFQATNGTDYWIQVGMGPFSVATYNPTGTLTWATASAPTGDTTSAAITTGSGRVDNFGNTDNEPPPNAVTRLSGHSAWWYTTGAVGRSKWFKLVAAANGTVTVQGRIFDDGKSTYSEYALLVYKGANFASLTAATTAAAEDAIMIGFNADPATTLANATSMDIDYTSGEIVWLCFVSLYDADYNADTVLAPVERCPSTELDLLFGTPPPPPPGNDDRLAVRYDNHYWLANSHWDDYALPNSVWPESMLVEGTTISATAEVGDPTVAGFAATRNVWYATTFAVASGTPIKIWVESSVDCVLGIYKVVGSLLGTPTIGALVAEDDNSGPGDWPEITFNYDGSDYYIIVDSKTEGDFTLKYQVQHTGTPPANDAFGSAEVISSIPAQTSGTTVGATTEPGEWDASQLGVGPRDTVWYKYVADHNGTLKIWATCDSSNIDAYVLVDTWHGTTLANLVRHPDPPPSDIRGFFNNGDTPQELAQQALALDIVNGETYYIRVQTETGGSEDFTIYLDTADVYLDLTPSTADVGPFTDEGTVLVKLGISFTEDFHVVNAVDADTIQIGLHPSAVEFKGFQSTDSGTAYVNLQAINEHDCIFHLEPSWIVDGIRKWQWNGTSRRWAESDPGRRWAWVEGEGQPQVC